MVRSGLRNAITDFVDKIHAQVDTHTLEDILAGRLVPDGRDLGGNEPEAWMEDNIIYDPILDDVLQLRKNRFPYSDERIPDRPDFELTEYGILGENKIVNNYETAVDELKDYLKNKGFDEEFGIATDGLKWGLYRIDTGGDFLEYDDVAVVDLRPVAREYAVEQGYIGQATLEDADTDESLDSFIENFSADGLEHHIDTAPQKFRDDRKGTIDDFYDLYVELLFGEGEEDYTYSTTLLDDISPPGGASESDERVFAVTLVNRLLFIKLLEDRDVLSEGFLRDRVTDWRESNERLAGDINLYDDQIKPLFYNLFNTPRDERTPPYNNPDKWFSQVDYLNGGLFRENVDNEKKYQVANRILPDIINDLIEGHELGRDNGLDPAILGSVFEMTINHISGEEGRQEDIGAFYTPNDATQLVTEQTLDEVVQDTLMEVYGQYYDQIDERSEPFALEQMLRWIEDGEQWFGDPEATKEAYDQLGTLKILDPACGSGHFLTSAMNELHRVRLSLMRGMGWDEEDNWETRVYEAKEELALNAIYGVDVDRVAVEIAKLRVWLKIIEEGWDESYGKLPNIDFNVVAGNTLIGLPERARGQVSLNVFQSSVERIEELRREYKQENEDVRGEITERLEELNEKLTEEYLTRVDTSYDFEVEVSAFDGLQHPPVYVEQSNFTDIVNSLTLRKPGVDELSEDTHEDLREKGFHTNPAWGATARLVVEGSNSIDALQHALDDGFQIVNVERQPVPEDINHIEGRPFHWMAGFPEALDTNGGGGFDVVLGNPPYGRDVLELSEKALIDGFETANVNDIVASFVERELQLLRNDGYFGNVVTLKLVYQGETDTARDMLCRQLDEATLACFARRPKQVFEGCQVRTGILAGQKRDENGEYDLETSEFLRFFDDEDRREREGVFDNISFHSTEGLWLGEHIGDGNKAVPKVGNQQIRSLLETLKDESDNVFSDVMSRRSSDATDHYVWRREGISYFINPLMENLYDEGEKPREVKKMYFDSELEAKAGFLALQTSLYYLFWMVYGNEHHLPWKLIDAFPFPDEEELEEHEDEIIELADVMWDEMADRFKGGSREVIRRAAVLKPIMDEADDLIDPLYGFGEDEIEFVKRYQEPYRLSSLNDPEQEQVRLEGMFEGEALD